MYIMNFVCDKDTPCFSFREIKEIYLNAADKSTESLQETAYRLYPGRDPVMYENLVLQKGHGRAFFHEGKYRLPKWTIAAHPGYYGVMEDDTIYPFCDPKYLRRNQNDYEAPE